MARAQPMDWATALKEMNQAVLLCGGVDLGAGTRWHLFGVVGRVFFTIETPLAGRGVPHIIACDYQAAMALRDEATECFSPTLDVKRARDSLMGSQPDAGELPDAPDLPDLPNLPPRLDT